MIFERTKYKNILCFVRNKSLTTEKILNLPMGNVSHRIHLCIFIAFGK